MFHSLILLAIANRNIITLQGPQQIGQQNEHEIQDITMKFAYKQQVTTQYVCIYA